MPVVGTGTTLSASGPLDVCGFLVRDSLEIGIRGGTGQTIAASGKIPESRRVLANEEHFVDK
jgi:hypothetical protein